MEIREAQNRDFSDIVRLLTVISALHREGRPDLFVGESKYNIEQVAELSAKPDMTIFVADENGSIAGYIFCKQRTYPAHGVITEYKTLWIDDLCVDPVYRRRGVGKMLIGAAKELAASSGCKNIELNVWNFNESAISFYEQYGFLTQRRIMELPLEKE